MNPFKLFNAIRYLPSFIKLLWRLFLDRRTPLKPKLALLCAVVYFISPVDILPDYLFPLLGFAEDILILMLVLKYFIRVSPEEVVWEHVKRIEEERR